MGATMKMLGVSVLENYAPEPNTGCWLWLGALSDKGYPRLDPSHGTRAGHRFFYEALVGPIPDKMLVCHRCDTRSCVNPDHLFLGTHLDNTLDMVKKGRHGREKSIEFAGERLTARQWGERTGVSPRTIVLRLRKGMPLSEVLSPTDGRFERGPLKRRK